MVLGANLVNDINGLVGEELADNVLCAQVNRMLENIVAELDSVELLVLWTETLQNLERLVLRRLGQVDFLEPTAESLVLLNLVLVLVVGRGADDFQLTTGDIWLEDVGRVHRAFGGACADDGVKLINEKNHILVRHDLLDGVLQTLLELATELRACDHACEVERVDGLADKGLRDVIVGDFQSQTLDDGGLAHAGVATQDRTIPLLPRQNLRNTLALLLTANQRVDFAVTCELRHVNGVFG